MPDVDHADQICLVVGGIDNPIDVTSLAIKQMAKMLVFRRNRAPGGTRVEASDRR